MRNVEDSRLLLQGYFQLNINLVLMGTRKRVEGDQSQTGPLEFGIITNYIFHQDSKLISRDGSMRFYARALMHDDLKKHKRKRGRL
ncbi:24551_t:CDS:1, partial [Gigaspora margarita]